MKHIFAICKKSLQAFSIIETIVASVIFMIIFLIGMYTLTGLVKYNLMDTSYLVMEYELQKLRKNIILNNSFPTKQRYTYEWGEASIYITPYRDNVYLINLIAVSKEKNRTISYRLLQATP